MNGLRVTFLVFAALTLAASAHGQPCRSGASALSDAKAIAGVRGTIARQCPCALYNGSTAAKKHGKFVKCASTVIDDATDGTPLLGGYTLRKECRSEVRKIYSRAACGYAAASPRVICCEATSGGPKAKVKKVSKCVDSPSGLVTRNACYASPFGPEACSGNATNECARPVVQETVDIPSAAEPANTPGSPSVIVTNPKLLTQFGGGSFSLNNARYTRFFLAGPAQQPDAIAIFVPGFEGGASDFKILAELIIPRAQAEGFVLEVWAFDRRSNQLEDGVGLEIAEEFLDANIGLDWLFGGELTLMLHPLLVAGPNRRALFYDTSSDVPFIAGWTNLVFSRDIDAVVEAARAVATN